MRAGTHTYDSDIPGQEVAQVTIMDCHERNAAGIFASGLVAILGYCTMNHPEGMQTTKKNLDSVVEYAKDHIFLRGD